MRTVRTEGRQEITGSVIGFLAGLSLGMLAGFCVGYEKEVIRNDETGSYIGTDPGG